jgi:hypothetical protein
LIHDTPDLNSRSEDEMVRTWEDVIEPLKLEINNLVWMYMPSTMTLGNADKAANEILDIFRNEIEGRVGND